MIEIDITQQLKLWVECSHEVWSRWFRHRDDGAHEFLAVEESLFDALVLSNINLIGVSKDELFRRITVTIIEDVREKRTVCSIQKSGNLFCKTEQMSLLSNVQFQLSRIDSMGTMLDGIPYAEIEFQNGIFLEPVLENMNIVFSLCTK